MSQNMVERLAERYRRDHPEIEPKIAQWSPSKWMASLVFCQEALNGVRHNPYFDELLEEAEMYPTLEGILATWMEQDQMVRYATVILFYAMEDQRKRNESVLSEVWKNSSGLNRRNDC